MQSGSQNSQGLEARARAAAAKQSGTDDPAAGGRASEGDSGGIRATAATSPTATTGETTTTPAGGSTAAAAPVVASSAAVTINPATNNLTLEPGETFTEVITVTIPPSTQPAQVDVYFLADTTGSMGDEIAAVAAGANQIMTDLATALPGVNLAYGVGNYRDFPPVGSAAAFQHQLSPTTNTANASAAIGAWAAGGGGDYPEGQLFALDQLAIAPGTAPINWRPGSERIIVWFGDAPGHDPICPAISGLGYTITEGSVTLKLGPSGEGIQVLAISVATPGLDDNPTAGGDYTAFCGAPGGTPGQGTRIANATGGQFVTGVTPATIVGIITNLITTAVNTISNVSLVPTGSIAPYVVSISPAGGYGPLNTNVQHVLSFKVTFVGPRCTDSTQLFTGSLDVVADGVVVASKPVAITVRPCRRYVYSVKYVCGVHHDDHGCPVRPGAYATEININNPTSREARVEKLFLALGRDGEPKGREPNYVRPEAKDSIVLPPQSATMDDCCRISELLGTSLDKLNIGFVQITSDVELDVVAVYTASSIEPNSPVSIDVERYAPRLLSLARNAATAVSDVGGDVR